MQSDSAPGVSLHRPCPARGSALRAARGQAFCRAFTEAGKAPAAVREWPGQAHGCPVERNRLFVAHSIQPTIPLAGLVPAIYAFPAADRAPFEDVGGRNKFGQGEPKVE